MRVNVNVGANYLTIGHMTVNVGANHLTIGQYAYSKCRC